MLIQPLVLRAKIVPIPVLCFKIKARRAALLKLRAKTMHEAQVMAVRDRVREVRVAKPKKVEEGSKATGGIDGGNKINERTTNSSRTERDDQHWHRLQTG